MAVILGELQQIEEVRTLFKRPRNPSARENILIFSSFSSCLANRFPQLGLADAESLDKLREEFIDFQLSSADVPSMSMYKAADCTRKPRVGVFWSSVELIKTLQDLKYCASSCMNSCRFLVLMQTLSRHSPF